MPPTQAELDGLFSQTYEELRRLAASVRRGDPSETLNPTALVNEAYLKLRGTLEPVPQSRLHFKRIAARAMRQVLVDAARKRKAAKRGGGAPFVTLDTSIGVVGDGPEDLLALDAAMVELARLEPRQALMVEYRFFGGLDVRETARALDVSESTLQRDWRVARAWLGRELRGGKAKRRAGLRT